MTCQQVQPLIHGYMDNELDPERSSEIEQHLAACPACAGELEGFRALSRAISENAAYYRAPDRLQRRVRQGLGSHGALQDGFATRTSFRPIPRWRIAAAATALLILGFVAGAITGHIRPPASAPNALLIEEITASHVRSLMGNHLVDVVSSDQHTVKPWFDGKLDFSPPVTDLKASGFPLVGGRLDYLDNRPVAALVYRRHKHLINLYLWPSAATGVSPVRIITRQGYNIYSWTQFGMNYWAVSDVSPADLSQFVSLIRSAPASAGPEPAK